MKQQYKLAALAMAAALAAPSALAQTASASNVTVYGILDTGIEFLNHTGPGDRGLVRMPSLTGSMPSRFGLRGVEDLGGGLKAGFVLESGIAVDSGALLYGGRLFGRQSLVYLSGGMGTLTLGRQFNMTAYAMLDSDILGPNTYAIADMDYALANPRSDNAIGYMGRFDKLTVGATFSVGRDAAGPTGAQATNCPGEMAADKRACREWTAMLKYDGADFGLSASTGKMYGAPGALFGLVKSSYSDERTTLNAYGRLAGVKIGGGVVHHVNTSVASYTSNMYYIGAMVPAGLWQFDGQLGYNDILHSGNDAAYVALRATYNLSRRTALYGTVGQVANEGSSAIAVSPGVLTVPGATQRGLMAGLRHAF
ncbi:MAG: porin [Pseudomonadota bacterium]